MSKQRPQQRQRRRLGLPIAAALAMTASAAMVAFGTEPHVLASGSAPARRVVELEAAKTFTAANVTSPSVSVASCGSCHDEIVREWESSKHHLAASNRSFTAALDREPEGDRAFCRGCHAPTATDAHAPTPFVPRQEGIGCASCHATSPGHALGGAAHTTTTTTTKACASCHQFTFPSGKGLMQMTANEHAKSEHAGTACATCHMPRGDGAAKAHVDHRFDVGSMLARALVADVARASATSVAFRLRPGEIGHAFPTGDLYRRLRVTAKTSSVKKERYLSRHFKTLEGVGHQHPKIDDDGRDDRVGASNQPACFELDLGERAKDVPIDVEIVLERVEQPRTARESDAEVSARLAVVERAIPVAPATTTTTGYRPCRE